MTPIRTFRGQSGGWHAHFDGHTTTVGGYKTREDARERLTQLAAAALEYHHRIYLVVCANGQVLVVRWLLDGWVVEECSRQHPVAAPCRWVKYQSHLEAIQTARNIARSRGGVAWESLA